MQIKGTKASISYMQSDYYINGINMYERRMKVGDNHLNRRDISNRNSTLVAINASSSDRSDSGQQFSSYEQRKNSNSEQTK